MPSSMRQGGVEATKGADRPTAAAARAASAGVTLYRGLVGSPSSRAWSTTPIGWASCSECLRREATAKSAALPSLVSPVRLCPSEHPGPVRIPAL